jgi:Hydrolase N-terminal helical domain/Alpha/beta hydrolase
VTLQYISVPHLIAEVGGDPWAINKSLQAGRPAQIRALAEAFHDAGEFTAASHASFDEARLRFEESWNHDSAEVQRVTKSLEAQSVQLAKIGVDLDDVATTLVEVQRAGTVLISTVEARLQHLDSQVGQAADPGKGVQLAPVDALDALISDLEQGAIDGTKAVLAQLYSLRGSYSGVLRKALAALVPQSDAPEAPEPEESTRLPLPPTSAEDVNGWWKSLSQAQKDRLIAQHLPDLGNLNGIPVDVRSQINVAVMNDDLHRVPDTDVLSVPGDCGLSATAILRYNNACRTREGLATAASAKDLRGNPPEVFLLKYQPEAFGGVGAAAIAIGNPDTAANTAVLVDGSGSGVRAGTLADTDGVRLYEESTRADWAKQTAVVIWVGYDAPNTIFDPGLYEPNLARRGGRLLAADVNALAITRQGAPTHMTVIGHSYGSTVVSDAAASGMRTNDVVLVGSPGTDRAHNAADFRLPPDGHLYVGAASGDTVTWSPGQVRPGLIGPTLGGLGDDPSIDGFGSTRFKAEVPGYTVNPIYDHLHYFDVGSESLFSIADVVSGHGDALQHDGMTAHHRGEYLMGEGFDPEAWRPATTGHRHSGPMG